MMFNKKIFFVALFFAVTLPLVMCANVEQRKKIVLVTADKHAIPLDNDLAGASPLLARYLVYDAMFNNGGCELSIPLPRRPYLDATTIHHLVGLLPFVVNYYGDIPSLDQRFELVDSFVQYHEFFSRDLSRDDLERVKEAACYFRIPELKELCERWQYFVVRDLGD